jgi:hypothetical protein
MDGRLRRLPPNVPNRLPEGVRRQKIKNQTYLVNYQYFTDFPIMSQVLFVTKSGAGRQARPASVLIIKSL